MTYIEQANSEQSRLESLGAVSQYLSDQIPPLSVMDAVEWLLTQPPQVLAEEVIEWAAGQSSRGIAGALPSDYLFHALKKLHEIAELKLIAQERIQPYWTRVARLIVQTCPDSERADLEQSLEHLGRSKAELSPGITLIHRLRHSSDPSGGEVAEVPAGRYAANRAETRFSKLLDRLQQARAAGTESYRERVSSAVSLAAAGAQSSAELDRLSASLVQPGGTSGTGQVFRHLSEALPGWAAPESVEGKPAPLLPMQDAVLSAIRQVLKLSHSQHETWKRFQEMVHAAIDQFNSGSLARAVTMLEMSRTLIQEGTLDAQAVASLAQVARESIDPARLRRYTEDPHKHELLRRALAFFPEYSPASLLEQLESEPKRDRRRMLLNMIEVQGFAARDAAFERLAQAAHDFDRNAPWYFTRNLICILSRISCRSEVPTDQEIAVVSRYLQPSCPAQLVREAVSYFGQMRDGRSEKLLITFLGEIEKRLIDQPRREGEILRLHSILDRVVSVLSRYDTGSAWRSVVGHGLRTEPQLGDTLSRLSWLAGQDLSRDRQVMQQLVEALRARIPKKVLGVTITGSTQALLPILKALSTTVADPVCQILEQIARRFPEQECGRIALKSLQAFGSGKDKEAASDRLLGDLDLFGLPELLRQLARTRASGSLTLKNARGEPTGAIELQAGRMTRCSVGQTQGKTALYELLVKPVSGSFVFLGRKAPPSVDCQDPADDLIPLVVEGMRQYEDLQRARMLVPDGCRLDPTGVEPVPRPEDDDPLLFQKVWDRVRGGATPEQCEAETGTQQRQVRLLLARWVQDSNLALAQ